MLAHISLSVELETARQQYRECLTIGRSACSDRLRQIRTLEQKLRLARNYVTRYCRR
jgi:hypothetical protein